MRKEWQEIRKSNITHLSRVLDYLEFSKKEQKLFAGTNFPINIPVRILDKIKKHDTSDPLFIQYVSHATQTENKRFHQKDPVQDTAFEKAPKLLHKYPHRVLLLTTGACAMHCRYCFRQNYSYNYQSDFTQEIEYISSDSSIKEVILSGGDPLSLQDRALSSLLQALNQIQHVKIVRFHTRFILGIPERIDTGFLASLKNFSKQLVFVIHVNSLNELDEDIFKAIRCLQSAGYPVLTQTVLLKGVNDNTLALRSLLWSLISNGIIPYYLHQLDPVEGSEHFSVPKKKGLALIETLRQEMPGYALPRYVQEIPFCKCKTPITSSLEDEAPASSNQYAGLLQ